MVKPILSSFKSCSRLRRLNGGAVGIQESTSSPPSCFGGRKQRWRSGNLASKLSLTPKVRSGGRRQSGSGKHLTLKWGWAECTFGVRLGMGRGYLEEGGGVVTGNFKSWKLFPTLWFSLRFFIIAACIKCGTSEPLKYSDTSHTLDGHLKYRVLSWQKLSPWPNSG